jgi:peptide/nickel transport system ATP-binding protein
MSRSDVQGSDPAPEEAAPAVMEVRGLLKHFPIRGGILRRQIAAVQAVDGVSFAVPRGETLGIVGESGCGKSTTARLLMQLIEPDAGEIRIDGRPVGGSHGMSLKELRRNVQMVFQDSYSSLNPRLPILDTITYGPTIHGVGKTEARTRAMDILRKVGLDPETYARRYPHEMSGGQRQRVNIARALALDPRILILDEAVSALDKSVQAQVLNLLIDLRRDLSLTYLFISHDLEVVQFISDRVLVMYLGKVVELGSVDAIYRTPQHPYTRALLSAMPEMDVDRRKEEAPLSGDPPTPINPPSGCRFHPRCPFTEEVCGRVEPQLTHVGDAAGHVSACHMAIPGSGHSAAPSVREDAVASLPHHQRRVSGHD